MSTPKNLKDLERQHDIHDLSDVIPFGKFKGSTIFWILDQHPEYIVWLQETTKYQLKDRIYIQAKETVEHILSQRNHIMDENAVLGREHDGFDFGDSHWDLQ